jgi:glutamate/aspartate transport system substrate-binding protein
MPAAGCVPSALRTVTGHGCALKRRKAVILLCNGAERLAKNKVFCFIALTFRYVSPYPARSCAKGLLKKAAGHRHHITLCAVLFCATSTRRSWNMQMRKVALSLLLLGAAAGAAQAEDLTGTLKKINDSGVIVVGHRESSVPFSYYDNQQKVVGYSQDYSSAIVAAIKAKLNKPDLQIKMLPITSQNRIPLLQNGTYDFECGSTTNNVERQQQAAFSDTIFIIGTRLLVKKGGDIKDFTDLKGKTVVVTSGTTSEILLRKLNDEKKLDMRIISAKDHGDSFRTLETGRAVAFMMDDALLAGERAKAKKPDNWEITGTPQSKEAYGCMLRKDDPQFKQLLDDTIAKAQTSGEATKWFDKWFKQPIPPKNLNLNFELSSDMQALFKAPNDKAL